MGRGLIGGLIVSSSTSGNGVVVCRGLKVGVKDGRGLGGCPLIGG